MLLEFLPPPSILLPSVCCHCQHVLLLYLYYSYFACLVYFLLFTALLALSSSAFSSIHPVLQCLPSINTVNPPGLVLSLGTIIAQGRGGHARKVVTLTGRRALHRRARKRAGRDTLVPRAARAGLVYSPSPPPKGHHRPSKTAGGSRKQG